MVNTILTDDERDAAWDAFWAPHALTSITTKDCRQGFARAIEAAVLAKLREQEPVMVYRGRCTVDCGEHGHHDVELLKMIPAGSNLYAAPLPAVVQVPQGWKLVPVEPTEEMRAALRGPGPRVLPAYVGAQQKADAREKARYAAMLAAAPEAPAQGSEWLPLTPEEQNRLDGLLKHARWLAASMPAMDGLQHSWALNARQAMVRMHDWLKMYLPPTTPRASEAPAQEKSNG